MIYFKSFALLCSAVWTNFVGPNRAQSTLQDLNFLEKYTFIYSSADLKEKSLNYYLIYSFQSISLVLF